MEGFFGTKNLPEEIERFEEFGEEFGEQELVTIVVDCKDPANSNIAKNYLADLVENLSKDNNFKDIRFTFNTVMDEEKIILYYPIEYLYFLLDTNATVESVEVSYQQLLILGKEPQYIVSGNGKIYLLNMVLNRSIESKEQRFSMVYMIR
jgi:hypothetical protein